MESRRLNVTRFGVPNDGLDATDAVQKALDAAGSNGGGTVCLPRGRFQMNSPIRIPRCVFLKGAGRDLSQISSPYGQLFEALIYGTNSFGIEDLTIMAANHRFGILADPGTKPGAGHVTLRRLHIALNHFLQLQIRRRPPVFSLMRKSRRSTSAAKTCKSPTARSTRRGARSISTAFATA